jgi:hypothetical protein
LDWRVGQLSTSAQKASPIDDDGRARANGDRRVARDSRRVDRGMFTNMEDHALLDAAKHLVVEEHLAPRRCCAR